MSKIIMIIFWTKLFVDYENVNLYIYIMQIQLWCTNDVILFGLIDLEFKNGCNLYY